MLVFNDVREWLIPAIILVATWGAVRVARWATHPLVKDLADPLASVLYVLGLKAFADLAPLHPKFAVWMDHGIYIFGVFVVLRLASRAAFLAIEWSGTKTPQSVALQRGFIPLLKNLVTLFIFMMGAIMILKHFNYDVMSLITALGVGSLAVGLAAKETLSNMISGFTLIIDRNLRPGDRIRLNEFTGDVEEIGLRSTRIRIGNGNILIVPNSELVNTKILNLSLRGRSLACGTTVRIPYSLAFQDFKKICEEILKGIEKRDPARGSWVNLQDLSQGSQQVTVGFWVKDIDDEGAALSEFQEKLLARFAELKLELASLQGLMIR